jgi:hypothetical protein
MIFQSIKVSEMDEFVESIAVQLWLHLMIAALLLLLLLLSILLQLFGSFATG